MYAVPALQEAWGQRSRDPSKKPSFHVPLVHGEAQDLVRAKDVRRLARRQGPVQLRRHVQDQRGHRLRRRACGRRDSGQPAASPAGASMAPRPGDAFAVPAEEVAGVGRLVRESWGQAFIWDEPVAGALWPGGAG